MKRYHPWLPLSVLVVTAILLSNTFALAQKHEFAITAGGNFPQSSGFDTGAGFAVGANYAGRVIHLPLASLYGEIPLVVATHNVQRLFAVQNGYSSFFLTPGLKLKFAPEFPISPYVAAGVGWAHFRGTSGPADGNSDNELVWDWAGGLDIKFFPNLSFRGEVRDFHAGAPSFTPTTGDQHDIAAQLGLVFRF